jgi:hypothetical protein
MTALIANCKFGIYIDIPGIVNVEETIWVTIQIGAKEM